MTQLNSTPIRKVKLYGKLRKFGNEFYLSVATPAEAIRALCVQIPGFEKFLGESKKNNLEYAVFNGKQNVGECELEFQGAGDIRIAPVISGSKRNGLFQTILGAVLIAVAYFNPFGALTGPMTTALMAGGISMVAGGVVQMLSPQPKGLDSREPTENKSSYAFGNAVNTTAYGNPVPILGGLRVVGGAIISAGLYSEDIS